MNADAERRMGLKAGTEKNSAYGSLSAPQTGDVVFHPLERRAFQRTAAPSLL